MGRGGKPAPKRRGVLVVPILADARLSAERVESEAGDDESVARRTRAWTETPDLATDAPESTPEVPEETTEVPVPGLPVPAENGDAAPEAAAVDDGSVEPPSAELPTAPSPAESSPATAEPEPPEAAAPATDAADFEFGRGPLLERPYVRFAAFLVVLAGLAVAGLVVGRLARDNDLTPSVTTPSPSTPAPSKPAPRPAPAAAPVERWGPLRATPAGRLTVPTSAGAASAVGERAVVVGGAGSAAVQLGDPAERLDRAAALPGPRASAAVFATADAVYAIGGERAGQRPSDEIVRFDVASRRVTPAGTFIEPLAGAGYARRGDSLLIAGGWTGELYATAVLRFTLPDEVDLVARLPVALRDPAVALRSGRLYVAGGRTADGPRREVYVVDLASGSVSELGRLPRAVFGASLVPLGRKLYVLGGAARAGPVATVVAIDPATGTIEPAGRMPRPLAHASVVRVAGATYVLGGTGRRTEIVRLRVGQP